MLFFFKSLQSERIVAKRVFDVCKVRLISDDLFTTPGTSVHFRSDFLALLIICHLHELVLALEKPLMRYVALGDICQSFIYETAEFECCEVFESMIWWKSGNLRPDR